MKKFNTLGEKLKGARKEKDLSLKQLGSKSGVSAVKIGHWEEDTKEPNFFDLCCVAQVLGLSLEYLAGWNDHAEYEEEAPKKDPYVGLAEFLLSRNRKKYK